MRNIYELKITGKDVPRFIRNLHKQHIQFFKLEYQYNSCIIRVSDSDYKKLMQVKTIYEIKITNSFGMPKIKWLLQRYKIFLVSIGIGAVVFYFLTHLILEVEVVHNKKEIRSLVTEELDKKGISKFRFIKSFNRQEQIVEELLQEHKNQLEWLEIERIGTKYVVKVEERKLNNKQDESKPRDIVAQKSGIVTEIIAEKGEVITKKNDYVQKGDILISGVIKNKENIVGNIAAKGKVFAETWYNISVELPSFYKEEYKTGNKRNVLSVRFLNNSWNLFDFNPYKNKKVTNKKTIFNPLFPFEFSFAEEEELDVTEELYSRDQAILKASQIASDRLKSTLGKEDEILYQKGLKITEEDSKIIVVIFFKVKEDITSYREIVEIKDPGKIE